MCFVSKHIGFDSESLYFNEVSLSLIFFLIVLIITCSLVFLILNINETLLYTYNILWNSVRG